MLEMLRALARSEAATMEAPDGLDLQPRGDLPLQDRPYLRTDSGGTKGSENGHSTSGDDGLAGLRKLRDQLFGSDPEDVELQCQYCGRIFHLQDGGACFEGKAACPQCEQHLNRDVVLPAVGKHRIGTCSAAGAREARNTSSPSRPHRRKGAEKQKQPTDSEAKCEEDLVET